MLKIVDFVFILIRVNKKKYFVNLTLGINFCGSN